MSDCLNCGHEISTDESYCSNCGQKKQIPSLSFGRIISDFFSNIFNVESKIWQTLRDIWIPGKLTKAFVIGQRNKYYNPVRFFLVIVFTFFTLFAFLLRAELEKVERFSEQQQEMAWKQRVLERFDTIASYSSISKDTLLVFRKQIFDDELYALDSSVEVQSDDLSNIVSFELRDSTRSTHILNMTEAELKESMGEDSGFEGFVMLQVQKILKNLGSSISFLIGNGVWVLVVVILLMALFFKGLYFRHKYLYAAHFIFHLYGHTRLLFLAILGIFFFQLFGILLPTLVLLPILAVLYLFLEMRSYYKQNLFKTTLKFVLTGFAYMFLLMFSFVTVLFISFLLL